MKITITQSAEDSFREGYLYIAERSPQAAERIYDEVMAFIFDNLSEFPKLGHVYNADQDVYRLVHSKTGYNIYYTMCDDVIYILYIIDGRLNLNLEIESADFKIP